jgi:hypothetical protein
LEGFCFVGRVPFLALRVAIFLPLGLDGLEICCFFFGVSFFWEARLAGDSLSTKNKAKGY